MKYVSIPYKKDLRHLIKLLDDPDGEVLSIVSETIIKMGVDILPELQEELIRNYDNEIVSGNIHRIIQKIHFTKVKDLVQQWLDSYEHDLWELLLIIDKLEPKFPENEWVKTFIDDIYRDVWLELNDNLTPLEKIKIINHILFDEYQFQGNKENIRSVHNYLISNVLESRKSNSLILGIIYITIARKVGLPVCGVNLPMNFLIGYLNDLELETNGKINKVLFYINPFEQGKLLNNFGIEEYLEKAKKYTDIHKEEILDIVTNRQIGYVLLKSLSEGYMKEQQEEKAKIINQMLTLF
jgi:regulator of sirC expression with transglutaminase-like and TPR domain